VNLTTVIGAWGAPPDLPAKIAVALAAVVIGLAFVKRSPLLYEQTERRFLATAGITAGVLSVAYISLYLHGGPRIIDATSYFLQGRALSHGEFAWSALEPTANFRGRFLLYRDGVMGGIFPPGYPLLLAFGFLLGAPMVVGPAIAVGLVVATYRLARAMALTEPLARCAALLSVVCAALRYHTADTMSHGATALAITIALTAVLEKRAMIAWLAIGYAIATRPVSAIPIGVVALLSLRRQPKALVGLLPGIALLLLSQHAVTGSWFTSTQRMYYTLSDGPTGCFRYGFGADTGCVFEHGDFVHARLAHGYGVIEALGTTIRRLHHHLLDVANLEPLAFLVLLPAIKKRALLPSLVIGLHFLVYAPFYFDGDYPGGGARLFADVLPIEHVLLIVAVTLLTKAAERWSLLLVGAALIGFAIHASFEHDKLRDRDGGHPMFEKDVLNYASLKQGLVWVDTDHGFSIGHDPAATPDTSVVIARRRGDDRDRMLFDNLERPPSYWYRFDAEKGPTLVPWAPPEHGETLRFEAEAEWPALQQVNGFAVPGWTHACASDKRALVLTPDDAGVVATATIELPVPSAGDWEVAIAVADAHIPFARTRNEAPRHGALTIGTARFEWENPSTCARMTAQRVALVPPHALVRLEAIGGPVAVDAFYLRSLGSR
jgi:hypothetical protein